MIKSVLAKKRFKKMPKKASWIALAALWLSMPFSIPALAQIADRVSFSVPQKAVHVALPTKAGHSQYIVASNAPFYILSQGVVGPVKVSIQVQGRVNDRQFGDKAQAPGPLYSCSLIRSSLPYMIYAADQKTARDAGELIDQAVLIDIQYEASAQADFKIIAGDPNTASSRRGVKGASLNTGDACAPRDL